MVPPVFSGAVEPTIMPPFVDGAGRMEVVECVLPPWDVNGTDAREPGAEDDCAPCWTAPVCGGSKGIDCGPSPPDSNLHALRVNQTTAPTTATRERISG